MASKRHPNHHYYEEAVLANLCPGKVACVAHQQNLTALVSGNAYHSTCLAHQLTADDQICSAMYALPAPVTPSGGCGGSRSMLIRLIYIAFCCLVCRNQWLRSPTLHNSIFQFAVDNMIASWGLAAGLSSISNILFRCWVAPVLSTINHLHLSPTLSQTGLRAIASRSLALQEENIVSGLVKMPSIPEESTQPEHTTGENAHSDDDNRVRPWKEVLEADKEENDKPDEDVADMSYAACSTVAA
ncbi:hypothetical protein BDV96DRAFT_608483 [Lophiotrema nucula]|uniref:Uncharacterized protein n=1 Tax=Lophiotrema nucula TaxID=690887 RepID=A0A6A5YG86_9PLEO|nr:hypothetical protein BDV96DRAFT_608483 [Lophiotrema nucula]